MWRRIRATLVLPTYAAFGGAGAVLAATVIAMAKRAERASTGGVATSGEPGPGRRTDTTRDPPWPDPPGPSRRSEA